MRWKFFIPAVLITILIIAFNIFFLDKLIAKTLTASLQMIFQAKVEVGSVETRLKKLSIKISGFKIADKDSPMQNLIEFKQTQFSLMPIPLLSKKILIENIMRIVLSNGDSSNIFRLAHIQPPTNIGKYRKTRQSIM